MNRLAKTARRRLGAIGVPPLRLHCALSGREWGVRILDIRETTSPIASSIRNAYIDFGRMTTSLVAVVTDVMRDGQRGLIRERFAPRLLEAAPESLLDGSGANLDPDRVWTTLMRNEKPGGHGERSVAVGTIDMAVWDAVAKI